MAVATYTRHVLYTRSQVAMLRMISTHRLPELCDRNSWRSIDALHTKGAVVQQGERILLTERGTRALGFGTQRVVKYERNEEKKVDDEILAGIPLGESLTLELEGICQQDDIQLDGLDEVIFEDLTHDCLDYYRDWNSMPDPRDVQAWGEMVYTKISQRQASSIIKAAKKEQ